MLIRDLNLIQGFGANSISTSKHPPSEEHLDLTDKLGIVVIHESPELGPQEVSVRDLNVFLQCYKTNFSLRKPLDLNDLYQASIRTFCLCQSWTWKNHLFVVKWSVASHSATASRRNIGTHLKRMMGFTREMGLQKPLVTYVKSSSDRIMIV